MTLPRGTVGTVLDGPSFAGDSYRRVAYDSDSARERCTPLDEVEIVPEIVVEPPAAVYGEPLGCVVLTQPFGEFRPEEQDVIADVLSAIANDMKKRATGQQSAVFMLYRPAPAPVEVTS